MRIIGRGKKPSACEGRPLCDGQASTNFVALVGVIVCLRWRCTAMNKGCGFMCRCFAHNLDNLFFRLILSTTMEATTNKRKLFYQIKRA